MAETEVTIAYRLDKQETNKTIAAQKQLATGNASIEKSTTRLGKGASGLGGRFSKLGKDAASAQKAARNEIEKTTKAVKDQQSAVERANDEFGKTSASVALAGDVESNLRAVGGAASAAGLGGVGTAVGVGAEIPALVEALPRLKTAAAGLPATIGSFATALGPVGIAGVAAAGALALLTKSILDNQKAATESAQSLIDANTKVADALVGGPEAVEALRIQEEKNIQARELEREALDRWIESGETATDKLGIWERGLVELGETLGESPVEAAKTRLDDLNKSVENSSNTLDLLEKNMDKVDTTAYDAAKAEEELAEKRKETEAATKEAERKEEEAAREQQRRHEQAQREAEQSAQKIQAARDKYNDAIKSIATNTKNAFKDARTKNKDALKDLETSLGDDLVSMQVKANQEINKTNLKRAQEEQKVARNTNKNLRNIYKQGQREQVEAARNRDFLALAQARESQQNQLDDTLENANFERTERDIAHRINLQDLKMAQGQERSERLRNASMQRRDLAIDLSRQFRDIKTNRQRQLKLASEARNKELQIAQQGAQATLQLTQQFWGNMTKMAGDAVNSINGAESRSFGPNKPVFGQGGLGGLTVDLQSFGVFD